MTLTKYQLKDYAQGELDLPISSSATSMQLKTGEGAEFPDVYPYFLPIEKISTNEYGVETVTQYEQVKVTNKTGDVFTIVRAQNGTTAYSFDADDRVSLHLVSAVITDIQDAVQALETGKLDTDALRDTLTANRIPYINGSGDETLLAFGSDGQVMGISGSSLTFVTPTTDIASLVEVISIDKDNDFILVYDASAGTNRKLKLSNLVPSATTGIEWIVRRLTDAQFITGTDTTAYPSTKQIHDKFDYDIVAGDGLVAAANATATVPNNTLTKVKEFDVLKSGTYTLDREGQGDDYDNDPGYSYVYVNGVQVSGEYYMAYSDNTWYDFTYDVDVTAGDLVQLYIKWYGSSGSAAVRNCRLKCSMKPKIATATVELD